MTAALGIVAGVALVALVWVLVALRSRSKRLEVTRGDLAEAEGRLGESRQAEQAARRDLEDERRRGSDADARAREAEQRASAAESRAATAEAAVEALVAVPSPAVLAEIERVRLEREWREISGLDAPLPVRWDASPATALEIELEIIREVTGTPSRLEVGGVAGESSEGGKGGESADSGESGEGGEGGVAGEGGDMRATGGGMPEAGDHGKADERRADARLWVIGSLGCELARVVARYADDMVVRLDTGSEAGPSIVAAAFGARSLPDLSSVEMAAKQLGVSLAVEQTGDGFVVSLSLD